LISINFVDLLARVVDQSDLSFRVAGKLVSRRVDGHCGHAGRHAGDA